MIKSYPTLKKLAPLFFVLFSFTVFSQTIIDNTPNGTETFTVPCGVTSITVEAWGGGGGGQRVNGNPAAGGGGSGGGYVKTTLAVIAGNSYNYFIGSGGSGNSGENGTATWFINNTTLNAVGGVGAGTAITANNSWGTGATSPNTGNVGGTTINSYGGNGASAASTYSGGGGSSGGTTVSNNAIGSTGGVAPTDGYAGANGISIGRSSGNSGGIGAGGSGGRATNGTDRNGGSGGDGQIIITYTSAIQTYCSPTFTTSVDPITNVTFAGINNTTTNAPTGGLYLENFCDIGTVVQGSATNAISLKGNTEGPNSDYFMVYIDWNQDGVFGNNSNEIYEIGSIFDSTGIDIKILTGNIAVPATAALGNTRMRVLKNFANYATNPCGTTNYGQAEDYTINVIPSISITTGTISPTSYCVGESVSVPYTITGTYTAGNIFTAQLSDASGSFTSPVTIGTRTATNAGTISGTIPIGTTAGSGYRIRVVSSNPSVIGIDNGVDLTVNAILSAPTVGTITQPTCAVGTGSVILNGLPSGSWELTRSPDNITSTGTGTSTTISNISPGTYTYTVIGTNNGTGLKAEYFNNMTLSGTPALTRTDATVNFDWGSGNPGAPIGNDNFSVRWSGQIQPLYSENYTFTTRSDDGIRLWVNGIQIINNWTNHGPTNNTGTITLTTGAKYDIVLEFYENGGGAVAELSWISTSQSDQIIPQSQLFPSAVCSSPASANVVINAQLASPTITPNKVDETCPASNNGSISPLISGGLSNVRYIKLTQKYADWQQLQEIQAFEIFTGTNVALTSNGASAASSSNYSNDATGYGPQKAIDGDYTGYSFWHSNSTNIDEYIIVDLASAKNIDYLRIYNRVDCCWNRGQSMLLELFDASNNLVYSKTVNLWGGVNGSHYVDVNVLDVSWADGATSLNRTGLDAGTYTLNYEDAAGCSISSQIDISSITTNNTWSGSVSTDWNTNGNWSCGGVPTLSTDVLIPFPLVSGNFPTISVGDSEGFARDIDIQSGASLTIEGVTNILTGTGTGNALNIAGNLTLNGKIDLEGESQLLQDPGSTFDAASTGNIEIDQQGEGNKYRYNYWSMPVYTGYDAVELKNYTTISAALRNGTNPSSPGAIAFTSGYDGSLSPFTLSTFWMYKFVDSGAGYSAWEHIGSTKKLYTGQGVSMKGPGAPGAPAQNYTFVGKPNNGTIEVTVAVNNEYLVGNPYPSAMDAEKFILDNANSITGAIYYWEHYGGDTHNLAGYQGGYATYSLGGGVQASAFPGLGGGISVKGAPKRNIPVGQAFFVFGDAVDGGQIQFNNGQRIFERESDGNSIFMKNSNSKSNTASADRTDLRPKFRIGFDAPKISHRQLLLTIDERASQAVDWGFDAEIYEVFADDMYWMLNNKKYVIQGTNHVSLNSEVPLGIQLSKTGQVIVKIDALENVDDDTTVYLKDKLTGESFNLRDKSVQLNLNAGKYADRFVIVFKTQKLVEEDVVAEVLIPAVAQPVIEGMHVFMNNAMGELQIKNNSTDEIISVSLTNAVGQRVNFWNTNLNQRTISLPVSTATGVYLVQITTKNGTTNKKIVVD